MSGSDDSDHLPSSAIAASAFETPAAPASFVDVPVTATALQMNPYFAQFSGCRHSNLERPLPQAAPDAHILDLRHDVPPDFGQYLDLATCHDAVDIFDLRSVSGSGESSDGSSFIDDEPVPLTETDIAFVAEYVAPNNPELAARLCLTAQQVPARACSAPVRKRCRVVSSSSSESSSRVSTVADTYWSLNRFIRHPYSTPVTYLQVSSTGSGIDDIPSLLRQIGGSDIRTFQSDLGTFQTVWLSDSTLSSPQIAVPACATQAAPAAAVALRILMQRIAAVATEGILVTDLV